MNKAIIIFVRNPVLGKVKTRLAIQAGKETALAVYKELLQHTHDVAICVNCDRFVFYADFVNEDDIWENELFVKKLQQGEELGNRMKQAFECLFEAGYQNVIIIGSDCPGLTPTIIDQAFTSLKTQDVVIGPSKDGGYYLLGLANMITDLFLQKKWSTDSVFKDTLEDMKRLLKPYAVLTELFDVDTIEDLKLYLNN